MSEQRFTDQVAIVTGGASGIGRAIADRLAREGALVVTLDLDQAGIDRVVAEGAAMGWRCEGQRVDITDDASVASAVSAVVARHGRLDIAVNSAGIAGPTSIKIADVAVEAGTGRSAPRATSSDPAAIVPRPSCRRTDALAAKSMSDAAAARHPFITATKDPARISG